MRGEIQRRSAPATGQNIKTNLHTRKDHHRGRSIPALSNYFVKCDAETNPPEIVEAGQVVCEIGVAPVKPAEFVIFRLSQFTGGGGAEVAE